MKPLDFKKRRLSLGLSQSQLASVLGCHRVTVLRWESGKVSIPAPIALVINQPCMKVIARGLLQDLRNIDKDICHTLSFLSDTKR